MADDSAGSDSGRHCSGNTRTQRRRRVFSPIGGVLLLATAALVSTVGVIASSATGNSSTLVATQGPLDDSFYTLPSPLPAGNPGDVIRYRAMKQITWGQPDGTTQVLGNAWQIIYLSTDANGQPNAVTGSVIVPQGIDPTKAKVVAFAPGTSGIAANCAPSRFLNEGSFYEQAALNGLLKAGYAVAMTDYDGYYQGGKPTYMVGQSMGPAVLNSVRAATRLTVAGLSASPDVVIQGYSQGGAASLWAAQIWSDPAKGYKDINLKGVSAGGVPANLPLVGVFINSLSSVWPSNPTQGAGNNNHFAFGFFATALIGVGNAYGLDYNSALAPAAQQQWAKLSSDYCTVDTLWNFKGTTMKSQVANPNSAFFYTTGNWLADLDKNTLGEPTTGPNAWVVPATPWIDPSVPVFHYHGVGDDIVSYKQDYTLHQQYCASGVNEQWQKGGYPWYSHVDGVSYANADVLAFIKDRFAGTPFTNNCADTP